MQKGVIIRHLLMPQATKEAMSVFDWVRENTPNAYFSFMSQYIPLNEAQNMPVINRKVTKREYDKVIDYITDFNFTNIYIQEKSSADKSFIPEFYNKVQEMD
jgi:putative pyruvate formate lyase activating enzyme